MTEKERIETIISHEGMTLSQFANAINIQTSTLSHIMSGRNNPSLDVMKRILQRFPYISPDWLIFGQEPMRRQISHSHEMGTLFDLDETINTSTNDIPENKEKQSVEYPEEDIPAVVHKTISRIIVFYSDNTFEEITK